MPNGTVNLIDMSAASPEDQQRLQSRFENALEDVIRNDGRVVAITKDKPMHKRAYVWEPE